MRIFLIFLFADCSLSYQQTSNTPLTPEEHDGEPLASALSLLDLSGNLVEYLSNGGFRA